MDTASLVREVLSLLDETGRTYATPAGYSSLPDALQYWIDSAPENHRAAIEFVAHSQEQAGGSGREPSREWLRRDHALRSPIHEFLAGPRRGPKNGYWPGTERSFPL